ncbi:MAG: hypothetical protein SGJ27_17155 [Candidatus Melainabacteria bacterium]|nr:hypothetical protein [Candidatus Melainabacteria bacterium]
MTKKTLGQVMMSFTMLASCAAPALALDYEAKPVTWVLMAPFRTAGALTGAAVSGLVSGPMDSGYHGGLKGTKHVAGKFGDEEGAGQTVAAVPLGGSVGMLVGGGQGVYTGLGHGWKKGWEKPFSRWSYITMEEK